MAFSEDNQRWILQKIQEATHPNGFKKAADFLRYWGVLGVCITAFLGVIGIAVTLGIFAFNRGTAEAEFRGSTKEALKGIDKRLGDIETSLLTLRVADAASQPTNEKNISEAKALLRTARNSAIQLPVDVVKDSGAAFIEAAAKEPAAWSTAIDFLNYRSTLNTYVRKVETVPVPPGASTSFDLGEAVEGKRLPQLSHIEDAPVAAKDAARFESIGHNLNEKLPYGSAELRLTGGAISLDDRLVAHAVFVGVEVHYTGKRVVLQDTLFIDCSFVFDNNLPARTFARELLASSRVTFESRG